MHTPEKVTFTDKSGKVSGESTSDLGLMRVTTNYDPIKQTGDERFIETVVGYAAPDYARNADGRIPQDPYPAPAKARPYHIGDQILNRSPKSKQYIGWVCTAATPQFRWQSWMPYGLID